LHPPLYIHESVATITIQSRAIFSVDNDATDQKMFTMDDT
jgi:hypothetical protein